MKWVLDTCVLYPTVMREVLLAVAARGLFRPLWSARILEEWRRASDKLGPGGRAQADGEIALAEAAWPGAAVTWPPSLETRLWLPDPADVHVLAAAVAGSAEGIVTVNAKDFPRGVLAEEGLARSDPDAFLMGFLAASPDAVRDAAETVRARAEALSGEAWTHRALFRKARLPRFAKALERGD